DLARAALDDGERRDHQGHPLGYDLVELVGEHLGGERRRGVADARAMSVHGDARSMQGEWAKMLPGSAAGVKPANAATAMLASAKERRAVAVDQVADELGGHEVEQRGADEAADPEERPDVRAARDPVVLACADDAHGEPR